MKCDEHEWISAVLGGVTFYTCKQCGDVVLNDNGWIKV
jgi:hypothetical protein